MDCGPAKLLQGASVLLCLGVRLYAFNYETFEGGADELAPVFDARFEPPCDEAAAAALERVAQALKLATKLPPIDL